MKTKLILGLCVAIALGWLVLNRSDEATHVDSESGPSPEEAAQKGVGSYSQGSQNGQWKKEQADGTHIVKLTQDEGTEMDLIDAVDRAELTFRRDRDEGMAFLRWCLFESQYSASDKELVLEKIRSKLSTLEASLIGQDILARQTTPTLYDKAIGYATADMNKQQTAEFLNEYYPKAKDPNLKSMLVELGEANGITLHDN